MNCLCSINTHAFHKVNAGVALPLFPTTNLLYNFSALSGTSTTTNGGAIATWTDARTGLVGSNYASCVYHTDVTINSRPTITGAVSITYGSTTTPQNSWTWYCVLQTRASSLAGTGEIYILYNNSTDLQKSLFVALGGGKLSLVYCGVIVAKSPASTSGGIQNTWASSPSTNYIFTMICSGSNTTTSSTQTYTYRINGVDYTPANPTDSNINFFISNPVVGSRNGGTQFYLGEQTLYNTVHSLATAQTMEQYLSNKWQIPIGSTPSIASSSPYSN